VFSSVDPILFSLSPLSVFSRHDCRNKVSERRRNIGYRDRIHGRSIVPLHVFLAPYHHRNWSQRVSAYHSLSWLYVTFVNSGVGYGICQRLLSNFCGAPLPLDALPQPLATPGSPLACEYTPTTKVTLILACRNPKKATAARDELLQYVDQLIVQQQKTVDQTQLECMKEFRKNLEIDLLKLDLASSASAFDFCDEVSSRYDPPMSLIISTHCW
jgi:hypothetical protein